MLPVVEAPRRGRPACRSRSTPTRRSWRAKRSPRARPSSTTSAACSTTRRWRRSSRRPARRIVLMHNRGRSRDMYREAVYGDVVGEIVAGARGGDRPGRGGRRSPRTRSSSIPGWASPSGPSTPTRRWPGSTGWPRSIGRSSSGPSRKSFLTAAIGERLPPSATGARRRPSPPACSVGAHIVRVHDVRRDGRRGARRGSASSRGDSAAG